ncbi:DUF4270 family protein [Paraflavisolibacter sp. H34]|uniref:DUF4270 family protein n=1 Tax=Huijunlia imazamoxiresistens TaxID=3127457 RepID=UPI0030165DD3
MKKQSLGIFLLALISCSLIFFPSCKKINEATELGGDLIPAVDNITTFESSLSTETDNFRLNDTTKLLYANPLAVAIGNIGNDPEFGTTNAAAYFNLGLATYGSNPFVSRDSIVGMDSVVLSLAFSGAHGDTATPQTLRVYEIAPSSNFNDTTLYTYNEADIATTSELGSRTFAFQSLKDSILLVRKSDTQQVANVLRIRLNNTLADRFAGFNASGPYASDLNFKTAFRGLAVKADNTGNGLGLFDLANSSKTFLTFYFRVKRSGAIDTTAVSFTHNTRLRGDSTNAPFAFGGQANIIRRTPGGEWDRLLQNGTAQDSKVYIQSQPGSYATVKVPGLDTLANSSRLIHLAELIIHRVPSAADALFAPPSRLFLDRVNTAGDTLFNMERDFPLISGGTLNFTSFGGTLRSDSTYRFNITKYVQDVVSGKLPRTNILRLSAPYYTTLFDKVQGNKVSYYVIDQPARGRVTLAGGNYADPRLQLRLRVVYSKL